MGYRFVGGSVVLGSSREQGRNSHSVHHLPLPIAIYFLSHSQANPAATWWGVSQAIADIGGIGLC